MPFLNLIQEHVLAAKRERKRSRFALLTLTLTAAAALGGNGYCLYEADQVGAEISHLKAQAEKHKEMLAQIELNRREMLDIAPRLDTLGNAQVMTKRWSTILDHLAKQTPPGAWLTAVRSTASSPEQPLQTSFQGLSTRQELVGEFILRLQACMELENVSLKFTAEKIASQGKGIEFDVIANVAGTAEKKAKDEQKETKN
jgi:Tfp pilus assembly protein PilN